MANDVVILDDVRTAIGMFGGSLAGIAPKRMIQTSWVHMAQPNARLCPALSTAYIKD